MRSILFAFLSLIVLSCNSPEEKIQELEKEIESLKSSLNSMTNYKPGFGDFMSSIQSHHNKLWFAGINENWDLADFEMHELEEYLEAIEEIHPNREETKLISMIETNIDLVEDAIEEQDKEKFIKEYTNMTNTCNTCHKATDHGFIHIIVPEAPAYFNQDFTKQ